MGKGVAKLMQKIKVQTMAPLIVFLSMVGSYSIYNNVADVYTMVIVGILAHVLRKAGFMPGPIVLGLILGPIAEQGLTQSVLMGRAEGSMFAVFFARPISLILIVLTIGSILAPIILRHREKRGKGGTLKALHEVQEQRGKAPVGESAGGNSDAGDQQGGRE
jgi:putative tricarboxylic transport membrane protein